MLFVQSRKARPSLWEDPGASEDGTAPAAEDLHIHHVYGGLPGARHGTRTGETPGEARHGTCSHGAYSLAKTKQEQGVTIQCEGVLAWESTDIWYFAHTSFRQTQWYLREKKRKWKIT